MINKYIKLFLSVGVFGYSVYQFVEGEVGNGIFLLLLCGLILLFYFKNEILIMAFLRLRKEDMEGAKKWLNKIKHPERVLVKKQQGYYNYILGLISSQKNLSESEKYLKKAIKIGLSMKHDLAMAKLTLAGIAMQKRRKREATNLISEAKKLDKHNMLEGHIKVIQQQLKRI